MKRSIVAFALLALAGTRPGFAYPDPCYSGPCQYYPRISIDHVAPQQYELGAVEAGSTVTFTVLASDYDTCGDPQPCPDTVRYSWDGGQTWGSETEHTQTFPSPGTYYVHCDVDDTPDIADDPVEPVMWTVTVYAPTYTTEPPVQGAISLDNDCVPPGSVVHLCATDGGDGSPYDLDSAWHNGLLVRTAADPIDQVRWSVSVGSVDRPVSTNALTHYASTWSIPEGTPPGVYTVTMEIDDAGMYGAGSLDSTPAQPFIRTARLYVGERTISPEPYFRPHIETSPATIAPGTVVTLSATDGAGSPARDFDSIYLSGICVDNAVEDQVRSIHWAVTDVNGNPIGTLLNDTGTSVQWAAPSVPSVAYVTVTARDVAAKGPDYEDPPALFSNWAAPIRVGGAVPAPLNYSENTVIARAKTFCGAINVPEAGSAWASYPATRPFGGSLPGNRKPTWRIDFHDGTTMEVSDQDGRVVRYGNFTVTRRLESGEGLPDGYLTADTAMPIAADFLLKAGYSVGVGAQLLPGVATPWQLTYPETAAGDIIIVRFPRGYQGIPFHDECATVVLQAETAEASGPVQAMSVNLTDDVPGNLQEVYPQDSPTVVSAATAALGEANIDSSYPDPMWKAVVRTNACWGSDPFADGTLRIAWVCPYLVGSVTYEVWVDQTTGQVIGGSDPAYAGGH